MTRLLRVNEAATLLGLQPVTVRRMIREHRLPAVRPTGARALRVREDDVEALARVGAFPARRAQRPQSVAPVAPTDVERAVSRGA